MPQLLNSTALVRDDDDMVRQGTHTVFKLGLELLVTSGVWFDMPAITLDWALNELYANRVIPHKKITCPCTLAPYLESYSKYSIRKLMYE